MSEAQPLGPILDSLGALIELDDDEKVTDAFVIVKVVSMGEGWGDGPGLVLCRTPGTDWITVRGLMASAKEILQAVNPVISDDED